MTLASLPFEDILFSVEFTHVINENFWVRMFLIFAVVPTGMTFQLGIRVTNEAKLLVAYVDSICQNVVNVAEHAIFSRAKVVALTEVFHGERQAEEVW